MKSYHFVLATIVAIVAAVTPAHSCVQPYPPNVQVLFLKTGVIAGGQGQEEDVIMTFRLTVFGGEAFGDVGGAECGCVLSLPSSYFGAGFCQVLSATIVDPDDNATPFGTFNPNSTTANSFATEIENQLGPDALDGFSLFGFATVLANTVAAGTPLKLVFDISCPFSIGARLEPAIEDVLGHSGIMGTGPLNNDGTVNTSNPAHVGVTVVSVASSQCPRTIAKETSKLIAVKSKALQRCEDAKVADAYAGICPDAGAANGSAGKKSADAIATATLKFEQAIGKRCGGPDKTCGTGDPGDLEPLAIGWPTTCPNFNNGGCTNAIDDCGDIATCIECVTGAAVNASIDLSYDDLTDTDPQTQAALNGCQRAIGSATAKFLAVKEKTIAKCWDKALKGQGALGPGANKVGSTMCPDAGGTPGGAAAKAAQKIAAAEADKVLAICAACGGPSAQCDVDVDTSLIVPGGVTIAGGGPTDDLGVALLRTSTACPDVTLPFAPGTACASLDDIDGASDAIDSLRELILCVDCVTEFDVDCADRARVPAGPPTNAPVPSECNP